jgi:predicted secreted protein
LAEVAEESGRAVTTPGTAATETPRFLLLLGAHGAVGLSSGGCQSLNGSQWRSAMRDIPERRDSEEYAAATVREAMEKLGERERREMWCRCILVNIRP